MRSESKAIQVPKHWKRMNLGNVLTKLANGISRKQVKKQTKYPVTRIETIADGYIDTSRLGYLSEMSTNECKKYQLIPGDILFSNINSLPHLGKTAIVRSGTGKLYHGMNLLLLRPNSDIIIPEFLQYLCMNYRYSGKFASIARHAVNQASINQKNLSAVELLLPPLWEQLLIVSMTNSAFQKTQTTKQELSRIPELTRRLRMTILSKAFRGELTNYMYVDEKRSFEWIADTFDELERKKKETNFHLKPTSMVNQDFPKIPSNWSWIQLYDIASIVQYGTSVKTTEDDKGIPVLRMGNIDDGFVVHDKLKYLPFDWDEKEKYLLKDRDILFNRTNSPELVGKSAIFTGEKEVLFASYLIRIRTFADLYLPEILCYYINSPYGRYYVDSVKTQQVGQANVNGTKLVSMPIPLIPLNEQEEMLRIISQASYLIKMVENHMAESLSTITQLESSIMTKAFQGRLVVTNQAAVETTSPQSEQTKLDDFN